MVERNRMRTWLAVLVVGITTAGCHPLDDLLSSIFGRSMRDQPSISPYEAPRLPAEGTVPFAAGNFPAAPGVVQLGQPEGGEIPPRPAPGDMIPAIGNPDAYPLVAGLENPIPADQPSLARGVALYERACAPCHGSAGDGTGPVAGAAPVFGFSLLGDQSLGLNDSYIYSVIRVGRGAMPAYGHQISHYDRWHIVNYLRELQAAANSAQDR